MSGTFFQNADAAKASWRWPSFTPEEMSCHGDGTIIVDEEFMDRLQALRTKLGFALPISSGYRSPGYNAVVSHTGDDGPHTTGRAADIVIRGAQAVQLIGAALELGFTGIGVSQKGEGRFVHIDLCQDGTGCPRPTVWSY